MTSLSPLQDEGVKEGSTGQDALQLSARMLAGGQTEGRQTSARFREWGNQVDLCGQKYVSIQGL